MQNIRLKDCKTKLFRLIVTSRRRKNKIAMLKFNGVYVGSVCGIREQIVNHFKMHFK